MELKIPLDINKIHRDAIDRCTNEIRKSLESVVYGIVGEMFQTRQVYNGREHRPEGYMRTLIRQRVEEYATSPEFEAKIQEMIAKHLDAATDEAVKAMLNSAARKRVFSAVPFKHSPT